MDVVKYIKALIELLHEQGTDSDVNVREKVKVYFEDLFPFNHSTINLDAVDYDYEVLPSVDDQSLRCILYYNNLYTFVLFCGIVVPYYDWFNEEQYETETALYEKKIDPKTKVVMFTCYNKISAKYTYMGMTQQSKNVGN